MPHCCKSMLYIVRTESVREREGERERERDKGRKGRVLDRDGIRHWNWNDVIARGFNGAEPAK